MAMRTPRFFSRRRTATARVKSPISTPSVISSSSREGDKSGLQQHLVHQLRQAAMPELHRRQVDRDGQRPRPGCRLPACGAQNPFAERDDQTAFFRQRHKPARRHHAVPRMLPARQRLEPGDLPADLGLRLVVKLSSPRDRGAQVLLQRALVAQLLVHRHFEKWTEPRASDLARKSAASAFATNVRASTPSWEIPTPIVKPTRNAWPPISMSALSAADPFGQRLRHRRLRASRGDDRGFVATQPRQKRALACRLQPAATSRSRASPMTCPNTSLTDLKRSRSMHNSPKFSPKQTRARPSIRCNRRRRSGSAGR